MKEQKKRVVFVYNTLFDTRDEHKQRLVNSKNKLKALIDSGESLNVQSLLNELSAIGRLSCRLRKIDEVITVCEERLGEIDRAREQILAEANDEVIVQKVTIRTEKVIKVDGDKEEVIETNTKIEEEN